MNITLSEAFKNYQKENGFTSVVVNVSIPDGDSNDILVPNIRIGEPRESLDNYSIFYAEGVTFYVTNKLKIQPNISFDCISLLGNKSIKMHGYDITHWYENRSKSDLKSE